MNIVRVSRSLVFLNSRQYQSSICRSILKYSDSASSKSGDGKKEEKDALEKDLDIDLQELTRNLNAELGLKGDQKAEMPELDKDFVNFSQMKATAAHRRSHMFNWKNVGFTLGLGSFFVLALLFMRKKRLDEEAKHRKKMAGKARIGGEWELLNADGKLEGSKELLGKWVLMYFGFTNCPDICPDEIEKMVDIVDALDRDKEPIPVVPVFITVDPERDSPERVKQYCVEFSPKIRGYTGTKEQVDKVLKTFRIYHSQGPSAATAPDDYIVDHTVMMYLIDPEGNFYDYYGQNRRAAAIADVIRTKVLTYQSNTGGGMFGFLNKKKDS